MPGPTRSPLRLEDKCNIDSSQYNLYNLDLLSIFEVLGSFLQNTVLIRLILKTDVFELHDKPVWYFHSMGSKEGTPIESSIVKAASMRMRGKEGAVEALAQREFNRFLRDANQ